MGIAAMATELGRLAARVLVVVVVRRLIVVASTGHTRSARMAAPCAPSTPLVEGREQTSWRAPLAFSLLAAAGAARGPCISCAFEAHLHARHPVPHQVSIWWAHRPMPWAKGLPR